MAGILESLTHKLDITHYDDWVIFVERLNEAVRSGHVRRVAVLKRVRSDYEEWFLDPETGEVYVYLEPDAHSLPVWEKVDVLSHLEPRPDPAPLSVFKAGEVTVLTAHMMKATIETLVNRGLVEELALPPHRVPLLKGDTERWFRDKVSNVVYCLSEHYGLNDADDIRWEVVPSSELNRTIQ